MPNINKALDAFEKAVDLSFAGAVPSSLLARQDLEAAIVKLTYRETPLRDILKRVKGEGRAHLWNVRSSLGGSAAELTTSVFYADGSVPTSSDPAYSQKTAAYKYLGITANITGPMIASGRSFTDIEAEVAEAKLRQVIQAEEWALFNGNSAVTGNLQFDGLATQITTNVVPKSTTALGLSDIWKAIKLIRLQGGQPTHIFCSYGVQNQINQLLLGDLRYIAQQGTVVTMGLHANNVQTPAGVLPLVGDFFINPATPYPYDQTSGTPQTTKALAQYGSTGTCQVTSVAHGLITGQTVTISGATYTLYNATYTVTRVTADIVALVGSVYVSTDTVTMTPLQDMGAQGGATSSAYVLCVPEIEVVDLLPIGRTELAKVADTVRFYINEYSVLAVKAEPWQAVITGISDPNT
jgi:hypothetical protein